MSVTFQGRETHQDTDGGVFEAMNSDEAKPLNKGWPCLELCHVPLTIIEAALLRSGKSYDGIAALGKRTALASVRPARCSVPTIFL